MKRWLPAVIHGLTYTIPFLFLTLSPLALLVIAGTHMVIDRYRLARYVVWAKNHVFASGDIYGEWAYQWKVNATGYPDDTPPWLAVWLLII
ncbi:hypothetical protein LRR18_18600, partial [Mangrovimonas sp. AS39]|uniref:hypothetical protein n=1 Tax=Mangrovimonas futianensis TaxID=2895523 RepID=UPI001E61314D